MCIQILQYNKGLVVGMYTDTLGEQDIHSPIVDKSPSVTLCRSVHSSILHSSYHPLAHSLTHTHKHTHTHARTHAHTHARTHTVRSVDYTASREVDLAKPVVL